MRNTIKSIMIVVLTVIGISCADESLSPLQFDKVKKGTLLALRGDQLDAVYWNGDPYGAAFFADAVLGTETFDYDAEFLSEDPTSLSSVDVFVIKNTWFVDTKGDSSIVGARVALTNIPASAFKTTADYRGPWTSVSIPLTSILTAIGEDKTSVANDAFLDLYAENGIEMVSDLNLKDGSIVSQDLLVAAGLYESDQFYPAQRLVYGVEFIADAKPKATLKQQGQFVKFDDEGDPVYKVLPLMDGAVDTLLISFDQAIDTPPTVTISPLSAGTLGTLVAVTDSDTDFFIEFTAGASYTGDVTFTVAGATSAEAPPLEGLVSVTKKATMAVDNLAPFNTSFTTGTRVGKGQSATITVKFNEALGTAPKITIDANGTNVDVDAATDKSMTLSADGLTATFVYDYKDVAGDAVHGDAIVNIAGGKDKAGNAAPAIAPKNLTIDIGAAPAPSIALDGAQYDWGTQIKWTLSYAVGGSNPNGSTSGTVYYVAQATGAAPPTGFVGGDVPAFTMAPGVAAQQTGTVAVTTGTSGSVFSPFSPNGTLDVYAVIITGSGVISAISPATTVTMN